MQVPSALHCFPLIPAARWVPATAGDFHTHVYQTKQHVTKAFAERISISPCHGTAVASVGTHRFILEGSGSYCDAVTNCLKPCGTFTWQQPDAILFVKLVTAMPLMCYNMLPCVNSLFQLFIYWKA